MKKLMIGAAVAAITISGFAACSEAQAECAAWDLNFKLKTLAPKKTNCGKDACGESLGSVYYFDSVTRTLKGYLWACEYDCAESTEYNVVLWDAKNRRAIIAYAPGDEQTVEVPADDILVYGKKATKVAGTFAFAGTDAFGEDAIDVTAAGINGKFQKGDKCYIKSLSGYAAGKLAFIAPTAKVAGGSSGSLCEDPVPPEPCDDILVRAATFCDACCWTTWCDDTYDYGETMVPAAGTWSMKYNKKVSKGTKSMSQLVPGYAL